MTVKSIPDGYHTLTPFITAEDASGLLQFIETAFEGKVRFRMDAPGGKIGHAEIEVGDSVIMVADPDERDTTAKAMLHLYVDDVDSVFQHAVAAGGTAESAPETHFYGDRSGTIRDGWGNRWYISTHVEDVTPEEMTKRMAELARA
jgi:PhnB protein